MSRFSPALRLPALRPAGQVLPARRPSTRAAAAPRLSAAALPPRRQMVAVAVVALITTGAVAGALAARTVARPEQKGWVFHQGGTTLRVTDARRMAGLSD